MSIVFKADDHSYTSIEGEEQIQWTSVTSLISKLKKHFDKEGVAKKVSKNKKSKWYGIKPEDIIKIWDNEALRATTLGTYYHNQREADLCSLSSLEVDGVIIPIVPPVPEENSLKYAPSQKLDPGVYPEHMVYLKSVGICGQSDLVEVVNDKINIIDYKTNKKIDTESYKDWDGISDKLQHPVSHLDDCVAGDTKLITKKGIEYIKDCVGKEIEIWNGEEWRTVNPFKTGDARELFKITFSDGSYIDVTSNHKFLIKHRLDQGFYEKTTEEIITLFNNTKWKLRLPKSNINYTTGNNILEAYDFGFILGDGTVNQYEIKAELHNKDKLIKFVSSPSIKDYNGTTVARFKLNNIFCKSLKYDIGLPKEIFTWSKNSILSFIAGWADADGTKSGNGIRIHGKEDKLRDLQLLLTKCNINSSVHLSQKKGTQTNLGIRKHDLWYVSISKTCDIPTQRLVTNSTKESTKMGKYQIIKSIEKLNGLHPTYCLTETLLHQCVFNNVLTKQCNFNHYSLQLSIYMYIMLKHNPRLKPGKMFIHHVLFELEGEDENGYPITKYDDGGDPVIKQVIPMEMPYLKEEVIAIIKSL
jgi:hypothetical protein